VGQQWDSSDEDEELKKQGMATISMAQESSSPRLFNNFSDDEDHSHFRLMSRGSKVQESTTSSSLISSSSTPSDINDLDDEKEIEANMIKQFSKKGYKEIKRLLEKIEKKKVSLHELEDLLILEKERNLALERCLAEEAAKVKKLTTDLSLANNSNKRMSKDYTLANESLASIKATHSELQSSFSCLTEKHKILEENCSTFWESTKANPKATFDSSASTSKGCSICSNIDINALKTNHARLEETIKSKDRNSLIESVDHSRQEQCQVHY
jgi:chromosome segregation ATPase